MPPAVPLDHSFSIRTDAIYRTPPRSRARTVAASRSRRIFFSRRSATNASSKGDISYSKSSCSQASRAASSFTSSFIASSRTQDRRSESGDQCGRNPRRRQETACLRCRFHHIAAPVKAATTAAIPSPQEITVHPSSCLGRKRGGRCDGVRLPGARSKRRATRSATASAHSPSGAAGGGTLRAPSWSRDTPGGQLVGKGRHPSVSRSRNRLAKHLPARVPRGEVGRGLLEGARLHAQIARHVGRNGGRVPWAVANHAARWTRATTGDQEMDLHLFTHEPLRGEKRRMFQAASTTRGRSCRLDSQERTGRDSNPRGQMPTRFPVVRLKPLGHPSLKPA